MALKTNNRVLSFLYENSLFLILGTVGALVWANIDAHSYHEIIHGNFHFIVNDILMALFFGIAAKEIWDSLLPGGALSSFKKAATPLLATFGGVAGPALLFIAGYKYLNMPELSNGWAVPTATDIAFSYMAARFIFGKKHPAIVFLLLLAIADDAIGLVILAVFYPTGDIRMDLFIPLVLGGIILNILMNKKGVKSFWPYLIGGGILSWFGFFYGGIHPALALVPIIPTLPHGKKDDGIFKEIDLHHRHDTLNEFEHWWKNPVELILMLFGLSNAGVELGSMDTATWLIMGALLIGKPIGITLMTFISKLIGLEMPENTGMKEIVVLGSVAGIGFTVALFVAGVAFPSGTILDSAKMGALFSFAAFPIAMIIGKILRVKKIN